MILLKYILHKRYLFFLLQEWPIFCYRLIRLNHFHIKNNNLLNDTTGYSVDISSNSNTSIIVKVIADYKKLDLTKLNELQQTKPFTKVDYNKNTEYTTIKTESIVQGFTVEEKK